jgi:hypothetical protein
MRALDSGKNSKYGTVECRIPEMGQFPSSNFFRQNAFDEPRRWFPGRGYDRSSGKSNTVAEMDSQSKLATLRREN